MMSILLLSVSLGPLPGFLEDEDAENGLMLLWKGPEQF